MAKKTIDDSVVARMKRRKNPSATRTSMVSVRLAERINKHEQN